MTIKDVRARLLVIVDHWLSDDDESRTTQRMPSMRTCYEQSQRAENPAALAKEGCEPPRWTSQGGAHEGHRVHREAWASRTPVGRSVFQRRIAANIMHHRRDLADLPTTSPCPQSRKRTWR